MIFEIPAVDINDSITTLVAGAAASSVPIFIIDSGCSKPMCKDKDAFNFLRHDKTPVKLADGTTVYTKGIGNIGNLKNIYYVPALQFNLYQYHI